MIEPLKIYERNQGDTLYTVFSPFTKLADAATPDQPLPRIFSGQVKSFLLTRDPTLLAGIRQQLQTWKDNDTALQRTIKSAPGLNEAAGLSVQLSALSAAGLEALDLLQKGGNPGAAWAARQEETIAAARQSGGRCTLEVVEPVAAIIREATRK